MQTSAWLLRIGAVLAGCTASFAAGSVQTPLPKAAFQTGEPDGREYRIHIKPVVSTDVCEFSWHQTGPFGGYGGSPPKKTGIGEFALRTGLGGKPATTLKISVWCRGYAIALIDEPALDASSFESSLTLLPLKELPISARVLASPDGANLAGAKVRVIYGAEWLCSFFHLQDCLVPGWEVATGLIAGDNTLRIMVPDFMRDATVRKWVDAPPFAMGIGGFSVQVNRNTAPYDYWLDDNASPKFDGIRLAATYPELLLRPRRH